MYHQFQLGRLVQADGENESFQANFIEIGEASIANVMFNLTSKYCWYQMTQWDAESEQIIRFISHDNK